jgi:hypothetical protein
MAKSKKGQDSETIPVTFPKAWDVKAFAVKARNFSSVQDFVRELVRLDVFAWEHETGLRWQPWLKSRRQSE